MGKAGDDFLITATDFPHGDAFRQNQLAQGLMRRGDLSETTIKNSLRESAAVVPVRKVLPCHGSESDFEMSSR